jgi:hypothetical protein
VRTAQDLEERWFAGVHSDVGGRYRDGNLWRAPFRWIIDEAKKANLVVNERVYDENFASAPDHVHFEPIHNSLTPLWWPAEFFPKMAYNRKWKIRLPRLNLFRSRYADSATLDPSLVERMTRNPVYRPRNIHAAAVRASG